MVKTQKPLILSNLAEVARWPRYLERVQPLGANSLCILPLTTARQRLGTVVFASKQEAAYDPADLPFLDPPPAAAMAEARALLEQLGALDGSGQLTPHGSAMSELPLPSRLAHMVLRGAECGQQVRAARIAALLVERGLGGRSADLSVRLEALERDRSARAREAPTTVAREGGSADGGRRGRQPAAT